MSTAAKTNSTDQNPIEMYFTWYLDELKHNGFIKYYDREPETLVVMPSYVHKREKHFKVKENELEEFTLLQSITYTYDFRIIWEEKAKYVFTEEFHPDTHFKFGEPTFISHYVNVNGSVELTSFVDVKPHMSAARFGGKMSSFYTFPFVQKFLMYTRGLYINKTIPTPQGKHGINSCLFAKTFCPTRYRHTDSGSMQRDIKFRKTTIQTYVERQTAVIESINRDNAAKAAKNNQQTLL